MPNGFELRHAATATRSRTHSGKLLTVGDLRISGAIHGWRRVSTAEIGPQFASRLACFCVPDNAGLEQAPSTICIPGRLRIGMRRDQSAAGDFLSRFHPATNRDVPELHDDAQPTTSPPKPRFAPVAIRILVSSNTPLVR